MSKNAFILSLGLLLALLTVACLSGANEPSDGIVSATPVATKVLDIVSRDATAAAQVLLTATVLPPATPSDEFLQQERQYQKWMQTRVAEGALTATVTPTVTPTPTPIPADMPGHFIFQGEEEFGGALFRVTYAAEEWELEDAILVHRRLSDCSLNLDPLAGEVPGPRVDGEIELAGFKWSTRYFPAVNRISYILDLGEHYLFFSLSLPFDEEDEATKRCRSAAEKVIGTFEFVDNY